MAEDLLEAVLSVQLELQINPFSHLKLSIIHSLICKMFYSLLGAFEVELQYFSCSLSLLKASVYTSHTRRTS